ncbi:T9SS type A sorting domain-containing protein [Candidatus Poribacteria bacterium]|nr:T9SS type A sorting domain-containing protein [Candidatus Poribacteria bacterium]
MLVATNDGIVLANSLPLFDEDGNPRSFTMDLISYDAGTEANNELATHVPGPPFNGMERAPTADPIMAHPGIAGTADVGAAFGWTEPTATVAVEAMVEMPEPPTEPEPPAEPEIPTEPKGMFEMALAPGLNMISLPLMPADPYTASSFAEMIGATIVIKLDTAMQEFVGFTAGQEGDGFAIEGGQGYIVNIPGGGMVTFTGTAWDNTMEAAAAAPGIELPSPTWAFVVSGDLLETEMGASYTVVAKNLRTGEVSTRQVSSMHREFNTVWADLSRQSVIEAGDALEVMLFDDMGNIVSGPFTHKVGIEDLRKAYLNLSLTVGDMHPAKTILGQNFPNPFNPETWIPYQLEKSADVALQIYDTSGSIVRTIDLGYKPQGFYMTRSTAAYWDGRNNMGEQIASGVYFYSLQTPDFSATRKMLILK